MSRKKAIELPEVNFSEDGEIRYLHLGTEWIQGSMFLDRPYDIELEYVQRMFGWLLFFPHDEVKGAHAMQLGLGAGTITKFCYKKLKMTCTAIELNSGVLHACRGWFRLPPDDERLRVVLADAALEIQRDAIVGGAAALDCHVIGFLPAQALDHRVEIALRDGSLRPQRCSVARSRCNTFRGSLS